MVLEMTGRRRGIISVIVFVPLFVCVQCAKNAGPQDSVAYVFTAVARGSIEKTVSGSGSLEPVSTVKVIAQMSGLVEKLHADYNDHIRKGQVLAELNTDMLKLQERAKRAAVSKANANCELQKQNYRAQEKLAEKDLISGYELQTSKTALDVSAADLASAQSDLEAIETEINQYAYIKSPIDGIVLERAVDVGQNVVEGSSSNSSSLFTLAGDLAQMRIETTVDELDIASIRKGQDVRFTVEAIPGKTFHGKVETIYLVPKTTNNVVNYDVIVSVDNAGGNLYPGMTANAEFIVKKTDAALLVPNAALRYIPSKLAESEVADKKFLAGLSGLSEAERQKAIMDRAAAQKIGSTATAPRSTGLNSLFSGAARNFARNRPAQGQRTTNGSGGGAGNSATANGGQPAAPIKYLWNLNERGELDAIQIRTGITDGSNTEILSDENLEGRQVILKEKR